MQRKTSAQIQLEITAVETEIQQLLTEADTHRKAQIRIQQRLEELGFDKTGRLNKTDQLREQLSAAKRYEDDQTLSKVVWDVPPTRDVPYVVQQITQSRIYVKASGSNRLIEFFRDGRPVTEQIRGIINVPATMLFFAGPILEDSPESV